MMRDPSTVVEDGAVPVNTTYSAVLSPGQKVTATFTPTTSDTTFYMPVVAVSKHPDSAYTITADGTTIFGADQAIPPTDIDDLSTCWWPPREWDTKLEVTAKRLSSATGDEMYHIQPVGWEE
ncbi:hypothetical protein SAMN05216388_1001230 [Halorientalis persicus]|uniref:Uncharacterized protein n=1 Tax=Halorientalis persicus TaxID=1367881 RepID=A0A1H8DAM6_9EURY|nr:hypothetical protein [Halorientalis persicus]SEN04309.1 hypothetical protein SAMN05216388_1001230 [Halorientalis persicus]